MSTTEWLNSVCAREYVCMCVCECVLGPLRPAAIAAASEKVHAQCLSTSARYKLLWNVDNLGSIKNLPRLSHILAKRVDIKTKKHPREGQSRAWMRWCCMCGCESFHFGLCHLLYLWFGLLWFLSDDNQICIGEPFGNDDCICSSFPNDKNKYVRTKGERPLLRFYFPSFNRTQI